jgi:enamine deaminase RidA (YjgF/YER057c/UK114 family)
MSVVESRLADLGLVVPPVSVPVAAYVPAVRGGNLVFTSGQLPMRDGQIMTTGRLGVDVDEATAADCAAQCALNALAAVKSVIGDLDKVARVVKVVGFVASDPTFVNQPIVVNGASAVFAQAFGDDGIHARSSLGVAVLPLNSPVEIELIVEVRD